MSGTGPELDTVRERHRLGAAVSWTERQAFITASQRLALALHRADDAAQVGSDLPFDLDESLEAFMAAQHRYEEAVAVSRG